MLQTLEKNEIKDIVEQTKLKHIAIIMDGNRHWAKKNMLTCAMEHKKGVEASKKNFKAAQKLVVNGLNLYGCSVENWYSKEEEVDVLMILL